MHFSAIPPDSLQNIARLVGPKGLARLVTASKNNRHTFQPFLHTWWKKHIDKVASDILKGLRDVMRIQHVFYHDVVRKKIAEEKKFDQYAYSVSKRFVLPKRLSGKVADTLGFGVRPLTEYEPENPDVKSVSQLHYSLDIGAVRLKVFHILYHDPRYGKQQRDSRIFMIDVQIETHDGDVVFTLHFFNNDTWRIVHSEKNLTKNPNIIGIFSSMLSKKQRIVKFDRSSFQNDFLKRFKPGIIQIWDKHKKFSSMYM